MTMKGHTMNPTRPETERAILGSIMLDADLVMNVLVNVGCDEPWFSTELHRAIYRFCLNRFRSGNMTDSVITSTGLTAQGVTVPDSDIGRYLETCMDTVSTVAHVRYHAEQLRGFILAEQGILTAEQASQLLQATDPADVPGALSAIHDSWLRLCVGNDDHKPLGTIGDELIEEWRNFDPDKHGHVTWPLYKLNEHVGPLADEFVFIVAKESVGKTAFALQMILQTASRGHIASLASLESSKKRLLPRMIGQLARINTLAMHYGRGDAGDFDRAAKAIERIRALPLRVSDSPATIDQLYAWGKGEKAAGSKLIVVDNMRHIRPSQKYNSPVEQMRDFSIRLKQIRDDIRIPVVVLHHTNDAGDVSWAKDIRRDADILMFLEVDEDNSVAPTPANEYTGRSIVQCHVAKNRDGKAGFQVGAEFKKEHQVFLAWEDA